MKKSKKMIISIIIGVLILVVLGGYFFIKYQTFDYVEYVKSFENTSTDNANYKQCLEGVLRYSKDGVALLSEDGNEIWNQPCQMNHPMVEVCGNSVAIGDKGGTSILVFQKKGLKGEIQTTRPIEKLAVSSNGIVSAILKDEELPLVVCYDAAGNVLVKNEVSLTNMGYPIDVATSWDGKTQIVSYLYTEENKITTKIMYYYFGEFEEDKKDFCIFDAEFSNTVIPTVAYINENTSVLVADNGITFYKGTQDITKVEHIEIKNEIQSVAYEDDLLAVLLRNNKGTDYKLHIYNMRGKLLSEISVDKEYSKMQVSKGHILLYDGSMCGIYYKEGIRKFEGDIEENILEVFPLSGLNKYMVINASGFHEVQLAK